MKLISLNTWGGRVKEPLFQFIGDNQTVDIFCFQELYHNATDSMSENSRKPVFNFLSELQTLLPNHTAFYRPVIGTVYGIGIFIKKSITVLEEGEITIYHVANYSGSGGDHSRNMQWLACSRNGKIYTILNVHGLWHDKGKSDTEFRLRQSDIIVKYLKQVTTPCVLCGDFNLLPETQSIQRIEAVGMRNLIKEYGITSTRTSYYPKELKFADYTFVNNSIRINDFKIMPEEVSDHSAMFLDFE